MQVNIVPGSITARITGLAVKCEGCGVKTEHRFDDGNEPQPYESRAVICPACGAAHFHTFGDPLQELEDALKETE